ncbi:hypothetical protein CGCSCA4_v001537 [Colletotrichum siamense]|uniref:2EXR domain-containing protein n=1 Tax=Colletotrichum siamense TaxID=690259 RepID=A0A9P5F2T9_COLSI|nr:hypothetical protein CGCSCA4_v001537 [Colletotrichum siamense]KAF4865116.1 hypothetical protein CGCSCA2_v001434 [Colletotrichum siamense]
MATQTFHQFPMLPGEIRDQIWDLAVRPPGYRGVHIFTYIDENNYRDHRPTSNTFPRHLAKKMGDDRRFVGAPTPANDTAPHSWTAGNPSTYVVDGGLLTACKESYRAICRRYDVEKWSSYANACSKVMDPIQYSYLPEFAMNMDEFPATFSVESRGSPQCFMVLPCQDLVLLQVWDIIIDTEWVIERFMPFAHRLVGSSAVKHIALEFDSSLTINGLREYALEWSRDFERSLVGASCDFPDDMDKATRRKYDRLVFAMKSWTSSPDTRLWLVDRRLRQKQTVLDLWNSYLAFDEIDEPSHERLIFEAEDSSYFGLPNHFAWEFCTYEDQTNETTKIWDFISELNEVAEEQLLRARDEHYIPGAHADFHTFGILVCNPKH